MPFETMLRRFVELYPEDAAHAFEQLEFEQAKHLVERLAPGEAAALLVRLSPHAAGPILEKMDAARVAEILAASGVREAATLLNQLDTPRRDEVLAEMPDTAARAVRDLAGYPADTAGGIMHPRVASLPIDLTAQQAISRIRRTPRDVLLYLYVTQRDGKLVGVLTMRDLLLASPHEPIETLVRREIISLPATAEREEVVNIMRQRNLLALPVVDIDGRLIGVIKHSDVLEAGQLEGFEDLQKISGAGADERALSPVRVVVKSRLPWLLVNLVTAFMAAAVVGIFEDTIAQVAALAVLLPVVAGQGGNTGAQSLAVVIRGIALREIFTGVRRRVVIKETVAGFINGVGTAVIAAAAVFIWQRYIESAGQTRAIGLSVIIGVAMVINMGAAALAGAVIPLVLKSLGRDPAQSSSIFLTTVTDIVGFASFLGFAVLLLPMLK